MEGGGGCARPSGYAEWQFHRRPQVCAARDQAAHEGSAPADGPRRRTRSDRAPLRARPRPVRSCAGAFVVSGARPGGGLHHQPTPERRHTDGTTRQGHGGRRDRREVPGLVRLGGHRVPRAFDGAADDPASFARRGHDLPRRQEHAGPAGRGGRGRRGPRADARRPHGDRVHHRRAGRRGQGDPRLRQDQPGPGDQGRLHGRSRADRHRGQPARRPGVARGPAGQAGRRDEGATSARPRACSPLPRRRSPGSRRRWPTSGPRRRAARSRAAPAEDTAARRPPRPPSAAADDAPASDS